MTEAVRPLMAALLLAFTLPHTSAAQSEYEPIRPLPLGATLLTLPSPNVSSAGSWEVRFNHRFGRADAGDGDTFFGLDAGANVGMGLAYVVRRDLELALMRTNVLDTVELSAKYVVVQQAPAIPLSLSVRGGVDWRAASDLEDRSSLFLQAIVSRRLTSRVEIFALPTIATDAGRSAAEGQSMATFRQAVNVPIGAAVLVGQGLSVVAEVIPPNRDLPGSIRSDPGWALGVKKAIGGHHFELVVTNAPATTVDQYVATTHQGVPFDAGALHLGFNIERQFGGRRR